jgi:hypothetical protein
MALEEALEENTAALKANTAALKSGGTSVDTGKTPGKPGRKPAIKLDDVKAIAMKVQSEKGRPAAVALIKKHGATQLADLDPSKYAAFMAACEVELSAEEEPPAEEDDSL